MPHVKRARQDPKGAKAVAKAEAAKATKTRQLRWVDVLADADAEEPRGKRTRR